LLFYSVFILTGYSYKIAIVENYNVIKSRHLLEDRLLCIHLHSNMDKRMSSSKSTLLKKRENFITIVVGVIIFYICYFSTSYSIMWHFNYNASYVVVDRSFFLQEGYTHYP